MVYPPKLVMSTEAQISSEDPIQSLLNDTVNIEERSQMKSTNRKQFYISSFCVNTNTNNVNRYFQIDIID
ncbi:hypothetical protein Trydic_g5944 [Trypoxylus dichotomus]